MARAGSSTSRRPANSSQLPRCDGSPAPIFGGHVGKRFGKRPLVASGVLGRVLALTVLKVPRLHDDARPVRLRPFVVRCRVVDAHHHRMRNLAWSRRPALVAHIANDQGSVAELELRAVAFADAHALHKSECLAQPVDRRADIRVDQHGYDGCLRAGVVSLHACVSLDPPLSSPLLRSPSGRTRHGSVLAGDSGAAAPGIRFRTSAWTGIVDEGSNPDAGDAEPAAGGALTQGNVARRRQSQAGRADYGASTTGDCLSGALNAR